MSTQLKTKSQVKTSKPNQIGRFLLGVLLSALSGVLLLLSFPPYGIWPLMWIGFVPFIFAQYRLMPFKWSSLAVALANLFWLGPFLARLFGTEVGFFFTFLGVWIAILNLLISKERNFNQITRYRWLVVSGVCSFVGFEMVRATFIPLVGTSAFVGYTQSTQPWLIQPVSIFSVYGLDLVILLVNYSLALGLMALYDRKRSTPDTTAGRAAPGAQLAGGCCCTVCRLGRTEPGPLEPIKGHSHRSGGGFAPGLPAAGFSG